MARDWKEVELEVTRPRGGPLHELGNDPQRWGVNREEWAGSRAAEESALPAFTTVGNERTDQWQRMTMRSPTRTTGLMVGTGAMQEGLVRGKDVE